MRLRALVVALSLAFVACDTVTGPGSDRVDEERKVHVAEDEGATAAEIVEAGEPLAADRAGDGSLLVVYLVVGEGPEVSQAAWRMYDVDGEAVAEEKFEGGSAGEVVIGLDRGFLHHSEGTGRTEIIHPDGRVEKVTDAGKQATAPGDVPIDLWGDVVFRPDAAQTFTPVPRPRREPQGLAIDAAGRMWSLRIRGERAPYDVLVSVGGGDWQKVRPLDLAKGQNAMGFGVTPVGEHLVLPVVRSVDHANAWQIEKVAIRPNDAAPGAPWRYVDPGPAGEGKWALDPELAALDEQTFFISDWQRGSYALELESGEWSEVEHPTDEEFWDIRAGRGGLYAFHSEYGAVRFSADQGENWESLPH